MNKSLLGIVSLVVLSSSLSAFAECKQANLKSADGTQINIDYSSHNQTDGDTAWLNPTVHVVLSDSKCDAKLIVAEMVSTQFGFSTSKAQTLSWDSTSPCAYSAYLGDFLLANHGGAPAEQIAIKVVHPDGSEDWLVDPANGSHNFNYAFQTDGYSPTFEACK